MKASELIINLQEMIDKHGDLDVVIDFLEAYDTNVLAPPDEIVHYENEGQFYITSQ